MCEGLRERLYVSERKRERDWEGGDLYQTATFRSAEQKNYRKSARFHFTTFFPIDLSRLSEIERTLGKWRETSASKFFSMFDFPILAIQQNGFIFETETSLTDEKITLIRFGVKSRGHILLIVKNITASFSAIKFDQVDCTDR